MIELVEEIPTGHATALALEVMCFTPASLAGGADDDVPSLAPLALGPRRGGGGGVTGGDVFRDPMAHWTALLELAAARAALAVGARRGAEGGAVAADGAQGVHGSHGSHGSHESPEAHGEPGAPGVPGVHRVHAAPGSHGASGTHGAARALGFAFDARTRYAAAAALLAAREAASTAARIALPLVELAEELALTPIARELLIAAAAPRARPEIRRLYQALVAPAARPACDDALLAALISDGDPARLDAAYAELADSAPLLRHAVLARDARGGLEVDDAVLARLRGAPPPPSVAMRFLSADRTLDALAVERAALRELVAGLAAPRPADDPARVVVRGRRGAGRRSTIAALAAQLGRPVACLDAELLPRGLARAAGLRRELQRARIAGAVPVVSGLELDAGTDPDVALAIAGVLHAHPGPVVVRTRRGAEIPMAAPHLDVELGPVSDDAHRRVFARVLRDHELAGSAELLAARHPVGPGTLTRAARELRRRLDHSPTGASLATGDELGDELARQLAARAGERAVAVLPLPRWEDLVLSRAALDGLRALVGRARSLDPRGPRAGRGLTAVFHGPSGTGKSLAAGATARALGRAAYRVALDPAGARFDRSPDRQLDDVLDAAEDGGWVLVVDAAAAAAAWRAPTVAAAAAALTRRLEAFAGLAIVEASAPCPRTTAPHVAFGLPDEAQRVRLWAMHLARGAQAAETIDLAALARELPLSGAAIERCARRGFFLAREERCALTARHLVRAAAC